MPRIKITSIENFKFDDPIIWEKEVDENEFQEVEACVLQHTNRSATRSKALLYPIRTNNLENFAKDFFVPLCCMECNCMDLEQDSIFLFGLHKLAVFIDMLTLPIRLITCIPRLFINGTKAERTPLYAYIEKNAGGKANHLLSKDSVKVGLEGPRSLQKICHFIEVPEYPIE